MPPTPPYPLPPGIRGDVAPGFEPAAEAFSKLAARGRGGAALAVRVRGETVLDVCAGWADRAQKRPWTPGGSGYGVVDGKRPP